MPSDNTLFSLASPDGQLTAHVSRAGGMLTSLRHHLSSSLSYPVLYRAPWLDDAEACAPLPPLMQRLAGEWVGVPFGHSAHDGDGFFQHAPHGLPVNGRWDIAGHQNDAIQLRFTFPADYPLAFLQRDIRLCDDGQVSFQLTINARRACRLPIGLHPIFPIGGEAGEVLLSAENSVGGVVYPQATEAGVSQLHPLARFAHLDTVPGLEGKTVNLQRLPLPYRTEEIVQLLSPVSGIRLHYPAQQRQVTLRWDTQQLPHCLLWFSNGGRAYAPWNGRNLCLGVEPICSAWDLGPESLKENALTAQGYATAIDFTPETPVTVTYHLQCQRA